MKWEERLRWYEDGTNDFPGWDEYDGVNAWDVMKFRRNTLDTLDTGEIILSLNAPPLRVDGYENPEVLREMGWTRDGTAPRCQRRNTRVECVDTKWYEYESQCEYEVYMREVTCTYFKL